jgi:hypothetical protein
MINKIGFLLLLIFCLSTGANTGALDIMLPEVYEDDIDISNCLGIPPVIVPLYIRVFR